MYNNDEKEELNTDTRKTIGKHIKKLLTNKIS